MRWLLSNLKCRTNPNSYLEYHYVLAPTYDVFWVTSPTLREIYDSRDQFVKFEYRYPSLPETIAYLYTFLDFSLQILPIELTQN